MSFDQSYDAGMMETSRSVTVKAGSEDDFQIEIREPNVLNFSTILGVNIIALPTSFVAGLSVGVLPFFILGFGVATLTSERQGASVLFLPALIVATVIFLLSAAFLFYAPMLLGPNLLSWKIAKQMYRKFGNIWHEEHYTVQIALNPRHSTGLRALLDDCDDIGVLFLLEDELRFEGDCMSFVLPRDAIDLIVDGSDSAVYGVLGLGKRTTFQIKPSVNHPFTSITLAERRSAQLIQYYRYARILVDRLEQWSYRRTS